MTKIAARFAGRWTMAIGCAAACVLLALTAAPPALSQAAPAGPQQKAGPEAPPSPPAEAPAPQTPKSTPPPKSKKLPYGKPLTTTTEMTLVNASVLDPLGRIVTGLRQDNFRIFEDGVEQEVVYFASDDVPVSIGVIFDMSGSMSDKIQKSRNAAVQFFRTANPQDEFFLVDFNDRAELITPFTDNVDQLQNQLMYTAAHGMTALYDGVYLGLSQMRSAHHERKALLIISDGGDNHSRYTETDVRRFVQESDVQIYAIGLFEPNGGPTPEEQHGPALLADLTQLTGGRMFVVQNLSDLPDIATKISMELRNQYVLGYIPSNRLQNGKWRKIKVRLRPPRGLPPLTVYAKTGYYGPGH